MNKFILIDVVNHTATAVLAPSIEAVKAGRNQNVYADGEVPFEGYTTAALLNLFNNITGQNVTRFSTRDAGIKRLRTAMLAMVAEPSEAEEAVEEVKPAIQKVTKKEVKPYKLSDGCPHCHVTDDQTNAGIEGTPGAERMFCHHCGTEYHMDGRIYKKPASSASRSAAIADSWKKPEVAAKRAERHGVRVGGQEFDSVRQAFVKLGLPINEHIKFRMELKAAGTLTRYGKTWFVIER